jgi:hypothetical protein
VSKTHLSDFVFDRDVRLDCGKVDKYRREVCVVVFDGQDVNLAQVEAGLAWWYRKYQKEQTAKQRADYEAAEGRARGRQAWSVGGCGPDSPVGMAASEGALIVITAMRREPDAQNGYRQTHVQLLLDRVNFAMGETTRRQNDFVATTLMGRRSD